METTSGRMDFRPFYEKEAAVYAGNADGIVFQKSV